jgi:putative salt-induced outer membrane protein YdiY
MLSFLHIPSKITHALLAVAISAAFIGSPIYSRNQEPEELGMDYFEPETAARYFSSDIWDGSVAFGLNGRTGNSESVDMSLNAEGKRVDGPNTTDLLLTYFRSTNQIATVTDRLFFQARQERALSNPNFSWYGNFQYEWDRFRGFDFRIALHSGLGIILFEDDVRFLKSRVGAGASREFGGAQDEWKPELQFGLDWERRLTETTKLFATIDVFPNIEDFSDYRANTRLGFDTIIDPTMAMSLKGFIFNRHDSTPDPGFKDNDLDYGLALSFGF